MSLARFTLYCEGTDDEAFLRGIFSRVGISDWNITPTGGKHGMGAIAGFLKGQYLIIRDRDFDTKPTPDNKLRQDKQVCTLARSNIDNYILESDIIVRWWGEESKKKGWKFGATPTGAEVQEWIWSGVTALEDYQSIRWSLSTLYQEFPPKLIKTTWTEKGNLPIDLNQDRCKEEALSMITSYLASTQKRDLEKEFEQLFCKFKEQFQSTDFKSNLSYRYWFSGKDLRQILGRTMFRKTSFPFYKFYKDAGNFVNPDDYPDLKEFITLITSSGKYE